MLGFVSKRKPVTGDYAKELDAALTRVSTGKLSEEDREIIRFYNEGGRLKRAF